MSNDPNQEPTWEFCEFPNCDSPEGRSDTDMHCCPDCESWYCDRHGDDVCAECIEGLGLDAWLDWLTESPVVIKELRYRVVIEKRESDAMYYPFLTSTAALDYAFTTCLQAEERDGDKWIPLVREAT